MGNIGEPFEIYRPVSVARVLLPVPEGGAESLFLRELPVEKHMLVEVAPSVEPYASRSEEGEPLPFLALRRSDFSQAIKDELGKVVVGVAPTAHVLPITANQSGLAGAIGPTLSDFNYFLVEFGLNVMLDKRVRVPKLVFSVDLRSNSRDRTDVTAFDIAPADTTEYKKLLSGQVKINLGLTKLLSLVPSPIGQAIAGLLDLQLIVNPWEFSWGITRYKIDAAGKKDYKVYWKLYDTNVVQGFNPTIVLKARKNVTNIRAIVNVAYEIQSGLLGPVELKSNKRKIRIWPT